MSAGEVMMHLKFFSDLPLVIFVTGHEKTSLQFSHRLASHGPGSCGLIPRLDGTVKSWTSDLFLTNRCGQNEPRVYSKLDRKPASGLRSSNSIEDWILESRI